MNPLQVQEEAYVNPIQGHINTAADQLAEAWNNKKASGEAVKEVKKELKAKMDENSKFLDLSKEEKKLKESRKELTERLKEIKKEKEQMQMETDEYQEIEEFTDMQDIKFGDTKDRTIAQLSRDLADNGVIAEINYRSGRLDLTVARA